MKISLELITAYGQLQIWGTAGPGSHPPEWDSDARFAKSESAFLIGVAEADVLFHLDLYIGEKPSTNSKIYGISHIHIDGDGVEISEVWESNIELQEGILGRIVKVPWVGKTRVDLVASPENARREDGLLFPKSISAFLNPVEN